MDRPKCDRSAVTTVERACYASVTCSQTLRDDRLQTAGCNRWN